MKAYSHAASLLKGAARRPRCFSRSGRAEPRPKSVFPANAEAFEMLVGGDSRVSGQDLPEKNKFYYLVSEWLQSEVPGPGRRLNLKVKAHSGARIELHADELEKMRRRGDDIDKFHPREANLSSPRIGAQLDIARREYERPGAVDLVMPTGGITDELGANTINPFIEEEKVCALIDRYCRQAVRGLLEKTTAAFPNAQILVIGYFPIDSTRSDVEKITRYLFKVVKFPHPLQFILTNGLSRRFLKILRKNMARRSRLWVAESNRATRAAISEVNAKFARPRIVFVESPITEENCFGTKNSLFWETDRDNFPEDERYAGRKKICPEIFDEIKFDHYGRLSVRLWEPAAIGHPNVEGARVFAEAVKAALKPIFTEVRRDL